MTHGSLFSGIGGFDLAAHWAGITNVFAVEKEPFPQAVLRKRFPDTKIYGDIFDFDATEYRGRVDIISGGFPCQPFSLAGKRRGHEDDRYLWPQMLRVVQQVEPTWVIAENVRGLTTITNGETLERVISDLEAIGYEVQPFIIPAVALGAPHKRERIWIIASNTNNRSRFNNQKVQSGRPIYTLRDNRGTAKIPANTKSFGYDRWGSGNDSINSEQLFCQNEQDHGHEVWSKVRAGAKSDSNSDGERLEGGEWAERTYTHPRLRDRGTEDAWHENWLQAFTRIYGVDDGLPRGMDGLDERYRDRSRKDRIKACGNAIVPQIAYILFKTIIETEAA